MFQRSDIDLMAPVGSYESLAAAIQGGANSVYFGLQNLNMRAQSSVNFGFSDLKEIRNICSDKGIRTYLTLNTVIYDQELDQMKEIIDQARHHNIDALIASDHAVIHYARSLGMEVHASTQLNISNIEALRFYASFMDVVVLARELNLEQVKALHEAIQRDYICGPSGKPVQLEMFVHGALCMSVSGKCYLSLHEQNYSANRGQCLQTCRKGYIVTEMETGTELRVDNEYIMSPKDLCTIYFLNKIIDSGVRVLKIEGRARSAEYVKTVVESYHQAIHAIIEGSYNQDKIDGWMKKLSTVFNRGFWDGYYLGQRLGEWNHVYGSSATHQKSYVGKVTNYFNHISVAEIKMESGYLEPGDKILIIGPTTGVVEATIPEIRVSLESVSKTIKGDFCSIPVNTFLRRSDKVYKWEELAKKKII